MKHLGKDGRKISVESKSVLITGHTGFKGAWLALILSELGARVHGISASRKKFGIFNGHGLIDQWQALNTVI